MALTFSLRPCEFEKKAAGTSNTQDGAFQEALLKRGFPKTSGAKLIVYHQLAKQQQPTSKIRALTTGNAHTTIQEILQAAVL